jgi:hypothetical protein
MVDGLQVPVIPLAEVVDKLGTVAPIQMDKVVPKLKVGVTIGFTVTVKVVVALHCGDGSGVKVYTPDVVVLTVAGFQLPVMPFVEVDGNVGTVPPLQIVKEVPKLKVGMVLGVTVTSKVVVTAH